MRNDFFQCVLNDIAYVSIRPLSRRRMRWGRPSVRNDFCQCVLNDIAYVSIRRQSSVEQKAYALGEAIRAERLLSVRT